MEKTSISLRTNFFSMLCLPSRAIPHQNGFILYREVLYCWVSGDRTTQAGQGREVSPLTKAASFVLLHTGNLPHQSVGRRCSTGRFFSRVNSNPRSKS